MIRIFSENGYEFVVSVLVPLWNMEFHGTINKTHTQLVGDNDAFNSFCLSIFTDEYNPDMNSHSILIF